MRSNFNGFFRHISIYRYPKLHATVAKKDNLAICDIYVLNCPPEVVEMAYHKWDTEYYKGELARANKQGWKDRLQITDLQKQITELKGQVSVYVKPVLFVEQGSVIFMPTNVAAGFEIVTYKQGFNAPFVADTQQQRWRA
jgi:hypothetical protein